MEQLERIVKIDESRLSVKRDNDVSAVFFNNSMVLVLLERNKENGKCLFYRPNTYDYVIASYVVFEGSFQVSWGSGYYCNFDELVTKWN